jgi:phage shock protein PspC (stress-responsive transcriptional regulator)/predicted membrane protein
LKSDRVLGGVCSGLARYLGVDPILVRVVVAVLTLFAGGGILLYLAAWLLIPEEGRDQSAGQQLFGNNNTQTAAIVAVVVVVALMLAIPGSGWLGIGPHFGASGLVLLIVAGALVYWLIRREGHPPPPAATPTSTSTPTTTPTTTSTSTPSSAVAMTTTTGEGTYTAPTEVITPPPAGPYETPVPTPPVPPTPKKPRSVLGLLTVSATALVVGVLVMVNLAVPDASINAATIFASALATVAIGLLLGTIYGRSRGLIFLGVGLAVATALAAAVPNVELKGGVGERSWTPQTVNEASDEFRLGIGEGRLDLRELELPPGGSADVTASIGLGELKVLVPDSYDVNLVADISLGKIQVNGEDLGDGNDQSVDTFLDVPDETGTLDLNLDVGVGQITVNHGLEAPANLFGQGANS